MDLHSHLFIICVLVTGLILVHLLDYDFAAELMSLPRFAPLARLALAESLLFSWPVLAGFRFLSACGCSDSISELAAMYCCGLDCSALAFVSLSLLLWLLFLIWLSAWLLSLSGAMTSGTGCVLGYPSASFVLGPRPLFSLFPRFSLDLAVLLW